MNRLTLLIALLISTFGCDSVDPTRSATDTALAQGTTEIQLNGASAADFVYRISSIDPGKVFSTGIELNGGAGIILRSTGNANGSSVALTTRFITPDSISVHYINSGTEVATPITFTSSESSYNAGAAAEGPDSYHYYIDERGTIIVKKDYRSNNLNGPGTSFTTAAGETVTVTDVVYTLYGVGDVQASSVRFTSPSSFNLLQSSLSQ